MWARVADSVQLLFRSIRLPQKSRSLKEFERKKLGRRWEDSKSKLRLSLSRESLNLSQSLKNLTWESEEAELRAELAHTKLFPQRSSCPSVCRFLILNWECEVLNKHFEKATVSINNEAWAAGNYCISPNDRFEIHIIILFILSL